MKLKRLLILGLIVLCGLFMVACSGGEIDVNKPPVVDDNKKDDDKKDDEQVEINFGANETDLEVIKVTAKNEYDKFFDEATKSLSDEQKAILEIKYKQVIAKLEEAKGTVEEVKKELNGYYQQLNSAVELVKQTVDTFEKQKEQALAELKLMYDSIVSVANPTTVEYVKSLYDEAVLKINALTEESKDQLKEIGKSFAEEAKQYVSIIIDEAITIAIDLARKELKKYAEAAIAKIDKESLKTKVTELYNTIDLKIAGIIDSEKVNELIEQYIAEFSIKLIELYKAEAALTVDEYKALAIQRLDRIYNKYLEKVDEETAKQVLKDFYDVTVKKIQECNTEEDVKEIYDNIETTVKDYVSKDLIVTLINTFKGKIKEIVNAQLDKIPYVEFKATLSQTVETELAKFDNIKDVKELKAKFEEIKEQLPKDIEKAIKEHVEGLIKEAKEATIKAIEDTFNESIVKIDDTELKVKLIEKRDSYLAEINKIEDAETYEATLETIKANFAEDLTEIFKLAIKKFVDVAKVEADKVFEIVSAKLSEKSKTEFKSLYDKYILDLSEINDIETAAKDIETLTKEFLANSKPYINEVLIIYKNEVVDKIKEEYNKLVDEIDIETYKYQFINLFNEAINMIYELRDIETFKEESAKILDDYIKDAAQIAKEYALVKFMIAKDETIEYINGSCDTAIQKITDTELKAKVTEIKDKYLAEIAKIEDAETYEEAIDKIKADFEKDITELIKLVIKKYVDIAKVEADKAFELISVKLSEESNKEFKALYDEYISNLSKINNLDSAANEAKLLTTEFLEDCKPYIEEVFVVYKKESSDKIREVYNELINNFDSDSYKEKHKVLAFSAIMAIENLRNFDTFVEDSMKIIEDYIEEATEIFKEYATAKLKEVKDKGIQTINTVCIAALQYMDDDELKAQLNDIKDKYLAEIEKVEDVKTCEEAIGKIKDDFGQDIDNLLNMVIKKYVDLAKSKLDKVFEIVNAKLTEISKEEFKLVYDEYILKISEINDVNDIADYCESLIVQFLEDSKTYIEEALSTYKNDALDSIKEKYDEFIDIIDILTYKNQFINLFEEATNKIKDLNDIETFVVESTKVLEDYIKDAAEVFKAYANAKLKEVKEEAVEYISVACDNVIQYIEDAELKTELIKKKETYLAEIAKIENAETFEEAINEIKAHFAADLREIAMIVIKKYVDLAKAEADKVYNLVYEKLTSASQTAIKAIYDEYTLALSKIKEIETAAKDAEDATKKFLEDIAQYVAEALASLKAEVLEKVKEKYDEILAKIDLDEYKEQLLTLYNEASETINAANNIETFENDALGALTDFVANAEKMLLEYLDAYAEYLKTTTLAKGEELYDAVYKKEEYTSLGVVAKGVAKAKIEAAYLAFKNVVEKLTPDVGAKKVCDEAYELLSSTFDKALGIGVEE